MLELQKCAPNRLMYTKQHCSCISSGMLNRIGPQASFLFLSYLAMDANHLGCFCYRFCATAPNCCCSASIPGFPVKCLKTFCCQAFLQICKGDASHLVLLGCKQPSILEWKSLRNLSVPSSHDVAIPNAASIKVHISKSVC